MSRVEPLQHPFPPEFAAAMARVMPPGAEPLLLFKTLGKNPRHWGKFSAGSLLDKGPLSLRHREIVIDRTTARCGCEYEWGVHVGLFSDRVGLTETQVRSTVDGDAADGQWAADEAALIAAVDALIDRKRLSDDEFAELARHFDEAQIFEVVQLVAFYHGVSLICGAFDLPPEPGMPRFPTA